MVAIMSVSQTWGLPKPCVSPLKKIQELRWELGVPHDKLPYMSTQLHIRTAFHQQTPSGRLAILRRAVQGGVAQCILGIDVEVIVVHEGVHRTDVARGGSIKNGGHQQLRQRSRWSLQAGPSLVEFLELEAKYLRKLLIRVVWAVHLFWPTFTRIMRIRNTIMVKAGPTQPPPATTTVPTRRPTNTTTFVMWIVLVIPRSSSSFSSLKSVKLPSWSQSVRDGKWQKIGPGCTRRASRNGFWSSPKNTKGRWITPNQSSTNHHLSSTNHNVSIISCYIPIYTSSRFAG